MRISDWSSDVCSADLALTRYLGRLPTVGDDRPLPPAPSGGDLQSPGLGEAIAEAASDQRESRHELEATMALNAAVLAGLPDPLLLEVGRAAGRERGGPAVDISGVAGA